jgi:hypothetical protein
MLSLWLVVLGLGDFVWLEGRIDGSQLVLGLVEREEMVEGHRLSSCWSWLGGLMVFIMA